MELSACKLDVKQHRFWVQKPTTKGANIHPQCLVVLLKNHDSKLYL